MARWLTNYLLLSSFAFGLCCCSTTSKTKVVSAIEQCPVAYKQRINTATYNTTIDFYGKHLSGLLLFKAVGDTAKRVVFLSETGFKFFDFEFGAGGFAVKYCIPGLNKPVVVNTFKKDFGLLLNEQKESGLAQIEKDSAITITFAGEKNKRSYYTVDKQCKNLQKIEMGEGGLKSLSIGIKGMKNGNFDKVEIIHHNLNLRISLTQIDK